MPQFKHDDSEDLKDYEVLDGSETLEGNPEDDPLDEGVIPPDHWSAGMRYAAKGEEDSESLDELLAEEEPDAVADPESWDENATEQDITRLERDDTADPRSGRLVNEDEDVYDDPDISLSFEDEFVARDVGIDGGAATAEEAAVHVVDDPADPGSGE
jgi:hypothetical protein